MKYNGRVGITFSAFDVLHAGHILMLQEAKSVCDYLIVGLQTDPTIDRPWTKNKPVQSLIERQIQLEGCKYVDEIIVYSTEKELEEILLTFPIDVRIVGEEYEKTDFTGKLICQQRGIDIYYNKRDHSYSSTDLRTRIHEQIGSQKQKEKEGSICSEIAPAQPATQSLR